MWVAAHHVHHHFGAWAWVGGSLVTWWTIVLVLVVAGEEGGGAQWEAQPVRSVAGAFAAHRLYRVPCRDMSQGDQALCRWGRVVAVWVAAQCRSCTSNSMLGTWYVS